MESMSNSEGKIGNCREGNGFTVFDFFGVLLTQTLVAYQKQKGPQKRQVPAAGGAEDWVPYSTV